jgi:hypothetical protein
MKQTKVSLTIRLTPELMAYVKQKGASNYSHFVAELIRKEALGDVTDDVVARLVQRILKEDTFWERVDAGVDSRFRLLQMD